ncbi:hypothetical protein [Mesorhizobium sp. M2E.F.Ca.ET.209.01.1.1]|uniref:hypothetical protein n=1 Tax=Mesorhizobium sp. M2E.F.Ca.ET.209.01.1.1 TaxID=2500526 RepID=UPI001FEE69F0|nr:hypothetical protein [Mesorhizobium sp. M2E.F.Ca.ET.209.01.1.1]
MPLYRTQLIKDADGIRLYTKTGIDWTAKYRPLAAEAKAIEAESFIIEGETIVTNEAGLSDFHARCARRSPGARRIST